MFQSLASILCSPVVLNLRALRELAFELLASRALTVQLTGSEPTLLRASLGTETGTRSEPFQLLRSMLVVKLTT